MTLQDIYKMAEQWRNNDNKRYSVEFYNKVIIDLINRKQYAKIATGTKKITRTVLLIGLTLVIRLYWLQSSLSI